MIDGIAAVWLPVSDVDRAVDFYGDTLGLDVEHQEDGWAIVAAGHSRIGLSDSLDHGDGGAVVAFAVSDDLEEAAEGLPDASEIVQMPWGRFVRFHDLDGNPLQLIEPAEE